ncbi:MAG: hypothetical protein QMD32_03175 [Smithellaceae bacterium]|nr:hypothetical protein [Smithellaceae bacterium]
MFNRERLIDGRSPTLAFTGMETNSAADIGEGVSFSMQQEGFRITFFPHERNEPWYVNTGRTGILARSAYEVSTNAGRASFLSNVGIIFVSEVSDGG